MPWDNRLHPLKNHHQNPEAVLLNDNPFKIVTNRKMSFIDIILVSIIIFSDIC